MHMNNIHSRVFVEWLHYTLDYELSLSLSLLYVFVNKPRWCRAHINISVLLFGRFLDASCKILDVDGSQLVSAYNVVQKNSASSFKLIAMFYVYLLFLINMFPMFHNCVALTILNV